MHKSHIQISIQTKRFLTPAFAVLFGLGGFALIGKATVLIGNVVFGEEITFPAEQASLVILSAVAAWAALALSSYQIHETSTLNVASRRIERRYSLFGVTLFRTIDDMSKWTWIQPKTAYTGSRKLVINAGNENETKKTHLVEMPPEATWSETLALGKMIADHLSIECRPYKAE